MEFTRSGIASQIEELIAGHHLNRLEDYRYITVFDEPMVGFASGYDPIFDELSAAVSPQHLKPRDILKKHFHKNRLEHISVISWAMPFSSKVRESNCGGDLPSALYSVSRNNGGTLIHEICCQLVKIITDSGWAAVYPAATEAYDAFRSKRYVFASSWSERHVAYAAGLGRFGLNGCLLTPLGSNVRFASIVTDIPLSPTLRSPGDHRAPCLEDGRLCGKCMQHCPVQAISSGGLDKERCYFRKKTIEARFMEGYINSQTIHPHPIVKSGKRKTGYSLGCALCQVDVPCMDRLPEFCI